MLIAGVAIAVASAVGVLNVGGAAVTRARAEAVADLVALAHVTGGAEGAAVVAAANGAGPVLSSVSNGTSVVTVTLGRASATAAARAVVRPR